MPVIPDLTWRDLEQHSDFANLIVSKTNVPDGALCINLNAILAGTANFAGEMSDYGVIRVLMELLEAAHKAQISKNNSVPAGERLNSFLTPTITLQPNNGRETTVTRAMQARYDLTSASQINAINS